MWMKENRGGYNWSQRIADLTAEEWGSRSHRCKRGGGKRRAGAIAPGIDFDPERGGSYVRLSFAGPTSDIEEALRRLGAWLPGE